jgi:hypothetical protein
MAKARKPAKVEQVACEVCLKEVPKSEATVPEATDYVLYFCGLDCYEKWKASGGSAKVREQDSADIRRAVDDGMQDLRIKKP